MDKLKYVLAVVTAFFLIGCGSEKELSPLSGHSIILAFGDSLTHGNGAKVGNPNGKPYPAVLSELTGLTVINAGISGETTSKGVKRFQSTLEEHSPELVILLEGGNDILRNQPAAITKNNLSTMIEIAQAQGVGVVLLGVPEKSLFSSSAPLYAELAEQYDLVFDGDLLSDLLRSPKYKSDPIHLNGAGYEAFAEGVYELLKDNGAVE